MNTSFFIDNVKKQNQVTVFAKFQFINQSVDFYAVIGFSGTKYPFLLRRYELSNVVELCKQFGVDGTYVLDAVDNAKFSK